MKDQNKIWRDARNSPQTYRGQIAMSNGNYNINYMLSHDQIQVAALLNIAKSKNINFNESTKTCFIDGISIQDTDSISIDAMEVFFGESINNAVNNTKNGLPSFFSVDNGKHFVLISLLPSPANPNELSIVYTNSFPQDTTAKPFAESLVKYLKYKGVNVVNNKYIEISLDQQVGNCCGLSVADNIANITNQHSMGKDVNSIKGSLFTPRNLEDKRTYYQNFGQELFQKLNQPSVPYKQKATLDDIFKLIKNGHIESAVETLRSMSLSTKELVTSNLKLVTALEEIQQNTQKPIPLIEGYLDCIYTYNRKIGVDIKDYIRGPLETFISPRLATQLIDNIPISTKFELTKEDVSRLKNASEEAKTQKDLESALKHLHESAPSPVRNLITKIIAYAKHIFEPLKHAVDKVFSRNLSADEGRMVPSPSSQKSR